MRVTKLKSFSKYSWPDNHKDPKTQLRNKIGVSYAFRKRTGTLSEVTLPEAPWDSTEGFNSCRGGDESSRDTGS